MARTVEKGRDAGSGQFIPLKEAKNNPATTVIEKIKVGPPKKRK